MAAKKSKTVPVTLSAGGQIEVGSTAAKALKATGSVTEAAKILGVPRTTFYSRLTSELIAGGAPDLDIVEEHALKRKVRGLEGRLQEAIEVAAGERERADIFGRLQNVVLTPPDWLVHKPKGKLHHGIIMAFLSDTHLDEVVNPHEMNGVNAYNRDIAVLRIRKFFENTIMLTRDYIGGIKVDGLTLMLGGDMVGGIIHEELERTNDDTILSTVVFWAEQLAAGIELLLKFFPKIFVPAIVGNHGRLKKRPQYKTRARDNFDWLLYKMVANHFRTDSRVEFMIPDAPDAQFKTYDTRHLLVHGDEFSGGNGIGGLAVPIMRGDAKKQKAQVAVNQPYDIMWLGHWHQKRNFGSVRINGSTKGYDEYAKGNRFDFEPPQQTLAVATPERGITVDMPIFVRDKREVWK